MNKHLEKFSKFLKLDTNMGNKEIAELVDRVLFVVQYGSSISRKNAHDIDMAIILDDDQFEKSFSFVVSEDGKLYITSHHQYDSTKRDFIKLNECYTHYFIIQKDEILKGKEKDLYYSISCGNFLYVRDGKQWNNFFPTQFIIAGKLTGSKRQDGKYYLFIDGQCIRVNKKSYNSLKDIDGQIEINEKDFEVN